TFLVCDRVMPSNEGRGYVLRRVLRRAALFGRKLGEERFLRNIAIEVTKSMQHIYPELKQNYSHIINVINDEEIRFHETLDSSLNLLDGLLETKKDDKDKIIPGGVAFQFYDTYGLPREVLAEVAQQSGFKVDWEGFEAELERQRERARAAHKIASPSIPSGETFGRTKVSVSLLPTEFVGSTRTRCQSKVISLEDEGKSLGTAHQGQQIYVILDRTPFYGEMGGQVGDTGEIRAKKGRIEVTNTVRQTINGNDLIVHQGK
ncbi:unnamed protein product, partial [marine sediment metagenome]